MKNSSRLCGIKYLQSLRYFCIQTDHVNLKGNLGYNLESCKLLPKVQFLDKNLINNQQRQNKGYWENKDNIKKLFDLIAQKYNLKTPEDWNLITQKQIILHGGSTLLQKYSMYELKCLACPEGKLIFNNPKQKKEYWNNKNNILQFLDKIKQKYNIKSPEDWNLITQKQIQSNGGWRLLKKHSLYELKYMACPEGKLIFKKPKQLKGFWKNKENILNFLEKIKTKYNLKTPEDWNLITQKQIILNGGSTLFETYSLFDLKCFACPEGKLIFTKFKPYKPISYWDNKENILQFLNEIKLKYNFQSMNDWNLLHQKHITDNGANTLLHKYSLYDLKCLACPEGKLIFNKSNSYKPAGYWENMENILQFLNEIKVKYNFQSMNDWNLLHQKHIKENGASTLLHKYSIYDLKCLACPEGKPIFTKLNQPKSLDYWNNEVNRIQFIEKLKVKFNLKTPDDWKRISVKQLRSNGAHWLFYNNNYYLEKITINFEKTDQNNLKQQESYSLKDLIGSNNKRSSQRWLFLQIQKLFPHEEIIEDYFHPEISRESGYSVQFDIYLIHKKIAIEYHGKQHYEDIPSGFAPLEMNKIRDIEKQKLCSKYGIQLIIIPYWWDNKLDSLKETLNSTINKDLL